MKECKEKELEYYIHIPFCIRKCQYCDFLSFTSSKERQQEYVKELCREIAAWKPLISTDSRIRSIFIGGGTPSVLEAESIEIILKTLYRIHGITAEEIKDDASVEITIECNPGTVDEEKLRIYKRAGVNRISFGLQSSDNGELCRLGRIHTWEEFLDSYQMARNSGFDNINVDLMSALPGQTVESWKHTIEKVLDLNPEHISAYSLIIEEGTPFYDFYHEENERREAGDDCTYLPSEEAEREMYRMTENLLENKGYEHYEISNYAKPQKACKHNIGYWTRIDYKGFGLGASSLIDNTRYRNTDSMTEYLSGKWHSEEKEILGRKEQIEETMFLGLRMLNGISKQDFKDRFGCFPEEIYYEVIEKYSKTGHMVCDDKRIYLTQQGQDISNYILADFLFEQ